MLYRYTPLGQIQQVTDLTTGTVLKSMAYDHLNRPATETAYSPEGIRNTTEFTYDRYSRTLTTKKKDAGGTVISEESAAYNDAYNSTTTRETKTTVGDENAPSIVTTVYKDKLGREVQRGYFPDGVTERADVYTYDNLGNKLTAKTALDAQRGLAYTSKWEYDFAGRVLREYNALGDVVRTEYDALGNKVAFTDVKGGKAAVPYSTTYTYDALGRVLTQATPFEEKDGVIYCKVERNEYDAAGNVLAQKTTSNLPGEAESYTHTANVYDSRGRVAETVIYDGDEPGSHTRYEYDDVGNRIAVYTGVTDNPGEASKTSYAYNYLNKVASITDALGQMESYVYDSTGLLTEKTDRNGNTTTYLYDAMVRPVSEMVMDPDSRVTALRNTAYTKTGSKLSEENDAFQTTFQYDCMGHVIRESETGGVVKAYGHDWNGNHTAFTLDKGAENVLSTGYDYDKLNRMYIVREQGETIATYTYDDNGNRASLSYPDGTVTTYAYNLTNLVTRLINANGEDTLSAYEYTYYLNGNQASKADHEGKVTTYAYDELGQLQAEEESTGLRIAYDYDRFGNRAQMRVTGDGDYTVTYEYDKNNRLLRDVKRGRCYGEYGKRHSR